MRIFTTKDEYGNVRVSVEKTISSIVAIVSYSVGIAALLGKIDQMKADQIRSGVDSIGVNLIEAVNQAWIVTGTLGALWFRRRDKEERATKRIR